MQNVLAPGSSPARLDQIINELVQLAGKVDLGLDRRSTSGGGHFIPSTPPEVECIGKGKAAAPYEFGIKASIVTNNRPSPGGQSCCTPRRRRTTLTMVTPCATSST
jgi:hypothetical protein